MTEVRPGEDAVVQAERGLSLLDQAVRLRPEPTPSYHLRRADCLAQKGDKAGAARERAAAERLRPTTALDHFLAGYEAYRQQKWARALEEFDTTLRIEPGHFWAQCLSAITSIQTNQPYMARVALTGCIEREPGFAWLYLLRGVASWRTAVEARAAGQRQAATDGDGSFEAAVEAQFEASEADFRQVLELLDKAPNDELRYTAWLDRALMRFQRGRLDDAAADLRAAIARTASRTSPSPAWGKSSSGRRSGTRRSRSSPGRSHFSPQWPRSIAAGPRSSRSATTSRRSIAPWR